MEKVEREIAMNDAFMTRPGIKEMDERVSVICKFTMSTAFELVKTVDMEIIAVSAITKADN